MEPQPTATDRNPKMPIPKPLALPIALNRQGVDGAYLLLEGTATDAVPAALNKLKPNNAKLDDPDHAPVSGDHAKRWSTQDWSPIVKLPRLSVWTFPGVAA